VSGRRRLGLVAAAAGVALVIAALVVRRAGMAPSAPARPETMPAQAATYPAAARAIAATTPAPQLAPAADPTPAEEPAQQPRAATPVLTPLGTSRALEAIGKNEEMRRLYMRLLPLGLSREQQDRLIVILGMAAMRPAKESPTLEKLRADGASRVLTEGEAAHVRYERQRIDERAAAALRPALATVLTPAQLAKAGLSQPVTGLGPAGAVGMENEKRAPGLSSFGVAHSSPP
jgi:hypothetical protein